MPNMACLVDGHVDNKLIQRGNLSDISPINLFLACPSAYDVAGLHCPTSPLRRRCRNFRCLDNTLIRSGIYITWIYNIDLSCIMIFCCCDGKRPDHAVAGPSRGYPAKNSTAHFYVFSGAIQFGAYMLIPLAFWFA